MALQRDQHFIGRLSNMSNIYASLNKDSICEVITTYETPFDTPPSNYLKIDSHDSSLIGKKWNGSAWEEIPVSAEEKEKDGRDWRDVELLRTDSLMLLDDYPQKDNLAAYRQKLRDWPSTGDFPATKPTL